MELRKFTDAGIEQFRGYLRQLAGGGAAEPPLRLLTDPRFSLPAGEDAALEPERFGSRLEIARYLDRVLEDMEQRPDVIADDVHLWSWLSLFYFDQVCPVNDKGSRKPGREYRHIPEPGYLYGHRHLLMGAYLVYTVYGWGEELSRLPLHSAVSVATDFHNEIAGRHNLITNRGIMEGLHILYYDEAHSRPKRGPIMNRRAPGSLNRFINVVQQLDLTYDLYSMSGSEIVGLLPAEFDRWQDRQLKLKTRRRAGEDSSAGRAD